MRSDYWVVTSSGLEAGVVDWPPKTDWQSLGVLG